MKTKVRKVVSLTELAVMPLCAHAYVAVVLMALVLTGCDRAGARGDQAAARGHSTNPSAAVASPPAHAAEAMTGGESTGDVRVSASLVSAAATNFRGRLEHYLTVREILSSTGMSYAEVSNRVAHIATPVILDAVAEEYDRPVDRNLRGPKQRAAMQLYQVVYERGSPGWARAFALAEMLDYYCYNAARYPAESLWVVEEADRLELSANYDQAELDTYLSIKFRLCAAVHAPQRALRNIAEIERCVQAGLIDAKAQPVQVLPLMKAQALLNLRRVDEARAVLQEVYSRLDTVDSITRNNLKDGVEAFIKRNQSSQIYPELFNPQTGRRYDDEQQ